jgi:hypothetical protein
VSFGGRSAHIGAFFWFIGGRRCLARREGVRERSTIGGKRAQVGGTREGDGARGGIGARGILAGGRGRGRSDRRGSGRG